MFYIRWVGTHSVFQPKTMPLKIISTPLLLPRIILLILSVNLNLWAFLLTGAGKSTPLTRNIISGLNGYSCNFSKKVWHIKLKCRLTGALPVNAYWLTKRLLTAFVSVAAAKLSAEKKASGCLKSPIMPKSCSMVLTMLILLTELKLSSATG